MLKGISPFNWIPASHFESLKCSMCCFYLFNGFVWKLKVWVFFQWKPFQGMRSQAALCLITSSLPSCLLCCGCSCSASSTLPHGYCSLFLCWQPSAGLSDFGVSPLPEDWLSLVSQFSLGRQIHCHHCDVKFKGKKKRKIGKYSSLSQMCFVWGPRTISWLLIMV